MTKPLPGIQAKAKHFQGDGRTFVEVESTLDFLLPLHAGVFPRGHSSVEGSQRSPSQRCECPCEGEAGGFMPQPRALSCRHRPEAC